MPLTSSNIQELTGDAVGQADLSLGDGTLAPYLGLAATLAHGMDFFDRPSGVVIPQFASSLSGSLDPRLTSDASQGLSADQNADAPSTTTSSRDYDDFSDRVTSLAPAASAYDGFSDLVESGQAAAGGSNALANSTTGSQPTQTQGSQSQAATPNPQRSENGSGAAGIDAESAIPAAQDRGWRLFPQPSQDSAATQPSAEALGSAEEVARADPLYANPAKNAEVFERIKQLPKDADDAVRSLANTLTNGQADRLAAYLEAKTGIGGVSGDYDSNLQAEQARTENANPTAAAIGSIAGLGLSAGAINAVLGGGRLAGELLPFAGRIIPKLGRLTSAAEEAGVLGQDAKLAGNVAQSVPETAGEVGGANSSHAIVTQEASSEAAAAAQDQAAGETVGSVAGDTSASTEAALPSEGVAADNAEREAIPAWRDSTPAQKKAIRNYLAGRFGNSKELVYEFISNGLKYVGQTSRGIERILEHLRTGKLHPKDIESILFEDVPGGKFARELTEHNRIGVLGGPGKTANQVWPVGNGRLPVLPPTP